MTSFFPLPFVKLPYFPWMHCFIPATSFSTYKTKKKKSRFFNTQKNPFSPSSPCDLLRVSTYYKWNAEAQGMQKTAHHGRVFFFFYDYYYASGLSLSLLSPARPWKSWSFPQGLQTPPVLRITDGYFSGSALQDRLPLPASQELDERFSPSSSPFICSSVPFCLTSVPANGWSCFPCLRRSDAMGQNGLILDLQILMVSLWFYPPISMSSPWMSCRSREDAAACSWLLFCPLPLESIQ